MRVAIVHEWLTTRGSPERFLETVAELFPDAPIYTLAHDSKLFQGWGISDHPIHTSFIQRFPRSKRNQRGCLMLMPLAVEQFDLREFDVVISSSHAVAKGVLTRADQLHISYTHTPARYAWDHYHEYLIGGDLSRGPQRTFARIILHYLRMWDMAAANRVDIFIANSNSVARRIWKTYRRPAEVIYPPVDVNRFNPMSQRQDFYLTVSRFTPYKNLDLIVRSFTELGLPLVVIGSGPTWKRIKRVAGPNVVLLGAQDDNIVQEYMERCKAYINAANEDFGVTPVEALAAGAPVIAYGNGGVLETVIAGRNGILFREQCCESLMEAVHWFEDGALTFDPADVAESVDIFCREKFQSRFKQYIEQAWECFLAGLIETPMSLALPVREPHLAKS